MILLLIVWAAVLLLTGSSDEYGDDVFTILFFGPYFVIASLVAHIRLIRRGAA